MIGRTPLPGEPGEPRLFDYVAAEAGLDSLRVDLARATATHEGADGTREELNLATGEGARVAQVGEPDPFPLEAGQVGATSFRAAIRSLRRKYPTATAFLVRAAPRQAPELAPGPLAGFLLVSPDRWYVFVPAFRRSSAVTWVTYDPHDGLRFPPLWGGGLR